MLLVLLLSFVSHVMVRGANVTRIHSWVMSEFIDLSAIKGFNEKGEMVKRNQ